jgi:hypothetical protein
MADLVTILHKHSEQLRISAGQFLLLCFSKPSLYGLSFASNSNLRENSHSWIGPAVGGRQIGFSNHLPPSGKLINS